MVAYRSGVLHKFSVGKGSFSRKNWKERWFVLDEEGIRYFAKRTDETPKGTILWRTVTDVLPVVDATLHPNATDPSAVYFGCRFRDVKGKEYTLLLRCGTVGERAEWVETMRLAKDIVDKLSSRRLFQEIREEEDLLDEHDQDLDAYEQSLPLEPGPGSAGSPASSPAGSQRADSPSKPKKEPKPAKDKDKEKRPAQGLSALTVLKSLVSKNKKRFIDSNFNLDLVYVTPQLIAMGFPAEGREAFYRNKLEDVEAFMAGRHGVHYKVYNLCQERDYVTADCFGGRWERHPFEDHNPPPLALIPPLLRNVHQFISANPNNTAAIHCKAGKGRTGTLICAYLSAYNDILPDVALKLFGNQRATDGKGVTIPSQIRYVHYTHKLLRQCPDGDVPPAPRLRMAAITLSKLLTGKHVGLNPASVYFHVTQRNPEGDVMQYLSQYRDAKDKEKDKGEGEGEGGAPPRRLSCATHGSTQASKDARRASVAMLQPMSTPHTPVVMEGSGAASFRGAASFEQTIVSNPSSPRCNNLSGHSGTRKEAKKEKFIVLYDSRSDASLKVSHHTGGSVVTVKAAGAVPRAPSNLAHAFSAFGRNRDKDKDSSKLVLQPMDASDASGEPGQASGQVLWKTPLMQPQGAPDASHLLLTQGGGDGQGSPCVSSPSGSANGTNDQYGAAAAPPPLHEGAVRFDLSGSDALTPEMLQGDVRLVFYEESGFKLKSDTKLFALWFHTAFVDGRRMVFAKVELDGLHKDKKDELLDHAFSLAMDYTKLPPDASGDSPRPQHRDACHLRPDGRPASPLGRLSPRPAHNNSSRDHSREQSPLTSASGSPVSFMNASEL